MNGMKSCCAGQGGWSVRFLPPAPRGLVLQMLPRRMPVRAEYLGRCDAGGVSLPAMSATGQMMLPGMLDPAVGQPVR